MFDVQMKIQDGATKAALAATKAAAKAHSDGVVASGYELRNAVKSGMKAGAPGGDPWPPSSGLEVFGPSLLARARAQSRRIARRKRAPKTPPPALYLTKGRTVLKRLAGAVRVEKAVSGDETRVKIGFLTPRVAELAAYAASGPHTVAVTPKMRRLFFAVGLVIFKSSLTIPRREHVGPVYRRNQKLITPFIQARVTAVLAGRDPKGVSAPFG